MNALLANFLLIFHFLYVLYIIVGLLYIWVGYFLHWTSIRNSLFRWTHLGAMGIVILETVLGIFCPLTEWEAQLRYAAGESFWYPQGFIPYWVHQLLYYNWPGWVFQLIYLLFFAGMVVTLILIPTNRKKIH